MSTARRSGLAVFSVATLGVAIMSVAVVALFVSPLLVVVPEVFGTRGWLFIHRNMASIARSILFSALYSAATVLFALGVCVLPARVLARSRFAGQGALEAVLISPILVPSIGYAIGLHHTMIRLALVDTFWGVVVVLTATSYPYMLRALVVGFQHIDPRIDLCAANLGANRRQRLLCVAVPLLGPAIVAGSMIVFLVAFSEYFLVFLIGGGIVPSFSGYMIPFLASSDRAIASVLTVVFFVVPLMLFLMLDQSVHRYYARRGITRQ